MTEGEFVLIGVAAALALWFAITLIMMKTGQQRQRARAGFLKIV